MSTKLHDLLKKQPWVETVFTLPIVFSVTYLGIQYSTSQNTAPLPILEKFISEAYKANYFILLGLFLFCIAMVLKEIHVLSDSKSKSNKLSIRTIPTKQTNIANRLYLPSKHMKRHYRGYNGYLAGLIKKLAEDLLSLSIKSIAAIISAFIILIPKIELTPIDSARVYYLYIVFYGSIAVLTIVLTTLKKPNFALLYIAKKELAKQFNNKDKFLDRTINKIINPLSDNVNICFIYVIFTLYVFGICFLTKT